MSRRKAETSTPAETVKTAETAETAEKGVADFIPYPGDDGEPEVDLNASLVEGTQVTATVVPEPRPTGLPGREVESYANGIRRVDF